MIAELSCLGYAWFIFCCRKRAAVISVISALMNYGVYNVGISRVVGGLRDRASHAFAFVESVNLGDYELLYYEECFINTSIYTICGQTLTTFRS